MATGLRFGAGAKLYYNNAGTFGTPIWAIISNVGDLEFDPEFELAEATTRAGGAIAHEPTLGKFEVKWKMLEDMSDTVFVALKGFWLAKTLTDIFLCSGLNNATGENYFRSECKLNFKKSEPIKGINAYDVTAYRCYTQNAMQAGVNP